MSPAPDETPACSVCGRPASTASHFLPDDDGGHEYVAPPEHGTAEALEWPRVRVRYDKRTGVTVESVPAPVESVAGETSDADDLADMVRESMSADDRQTARQFTEASAALRTLLDRLAASLARVTELEQENARFIAALQFASDYTIHDEKAHHDENYGDCVRCRVRDALSPPGASR